MEIKQPPSNKNLEIIVIIKHKGVEIQKEISEGNDDILSLREGQFILGKHIESLADKIVAKIFKK